MLGFNPSAILFWAVASAIGFLVHGTNGAVIGFIIAGSISLIVDNRK